MVDEDYMGMALDAARRAGAAGEVPIGAVVVIGTAVVAGENRCIADSDPTAHAEVVALRRAAHEVGNYRLVGAEIFVTVEPCLMCVGALLQARVARVVYGCADEKAGFLGTLGDFSDDHRLNHRFRVRREVRGDEAARLLRDFFQDRRRR